MNNRMVLVASSLISLSIGALGGHYFTRRYLDEFYTEQIDREVGAALELQERKWGPRPEESDFVKSLAEEIAQADAKKTFYNQVPENESRLVGTDPRDFIPEPAKAAISQYQGRYALDKKESPSSAEQAVEVPKGEEEIIRSHSKPYRITPDECYQGEDDYTITSMTYYAGDRTVVDENEDPVEDADKMIGLENLEHFGSLGAESHIVCIRNDRLKLLVEVDLNEGKYGEMVAGFKGESEDE